METCGLFRKLVKPAVHSQVGCDGCRTEPICGGRWKCQTCPDYDLCDSCMARGMHSVHLLKEIKLRQEPTLDPIPLSSLHLTGSVSSHVCSFTLTQEFVNAEATEIEAVYVFPLDPRVAVTNLKILIDDKQIDAKLEEKVKAQQVYDDAIAAGHGGYLLEQSTTSKDTFTMNVGRLPPGKSCQVCITIVCEMEILDAYSYRLTIPTAIFPRYKEAASSAQSAIQYEKDSPTDSSSTTKRGRYPCYLVDVCGSMTNLVANVSSSSAEAGLKCTWGETGPKSWRAVGEVKPIKDIVVDVKLVPAPERDRPELYVELEKVKPATQILIDDASDSCPHMWTYAAVMTIVPRVDCRDEDNVQCRGEYIFLVDCSGSMGDPIDNTTRSYRPSRGGPAAPPTKMGLVKTALGLFVRGLRPGCTFNIVRFADSFESAFPCAVEYSAATFDQATAFIEKLDASGGTELSRVMKSLCAPPSDNPSAATVTPSTHRPCTIFLLTDGQVSDTEKVMQIAKRGKATTRVFSIGVGDGADRALVDGVARVTGGKAAFITDPSLVNDVVVKQQVNAMAIYFTDVALDWKPASTCATTTGVDSRFSRVDSPSKLPFLFANQRNVFYSIITAPEDFAGVLELYMTGSDGNKIYIRQPVSVNQNTSNKYQPGAILALAGRDLVEQLETEELWMKDPSKAAQEAHREKIVQMSLQCQVISKYTSFVAVEKRNTPAGDNMQLRNVPVLLGTGQCDDSMLESSVVVPWGLQLQSMSVPKGVMMMGTTNSFSRSPVASSVNVLMEDEEDGDEEMCLDEVAPGPHPQSSTYVESLKTVRESWHGAGGSLLQSANISSLPKSRSSVPAAVDPLAALLNLQSFDGSWKLSAALLVALNNTTEADLADSACKLFDDPATSYTVGTNCLQDDCIVTAFVVMYVFKNFADKKSTWKLLLDKAMEYIYASSGPHRPWLVSKMQQCMMSDH